MLKNIFAMLMGLSFAATAQAGYEVQISNSQAFGTGAAITLNDDGTDSTTAFGVNAEVYFGFSEQLQIGGGVSYADSGEDNSDATLGLAGLVRYNLSSELRDAVFVGGGVSYQDLGGDNDLIALHVQVGKRYAISETLTWTPNVSFILPVGGEIGGQDPEGYVLALNLISFSGFME